MSSISTVYPCRDERRPISVLARTLLLIAVAAPAASGCNANIVFERLAESRQLAADMQVQFTKAADAANLAVIAETEAASGDFVREADEAKQAVERDTEALRRARQSLGYADEVRLVEEFASRFADYRTLDSTILGLALENTNVKARQLSFGPAQQEADAFRDALQAASAKSAASDRWRIASLVATTVAGVREIQALQAPHIAAADDAAMTRIEERMGTAEAAARSALMALAPLGPDATRSAVASATAALDRFMAVNAQIVALSRRNTNVRSLALSLTQKREVTSACDEHLRALRDALAKRGFMGTR